MGRLKLPINNRSWLVTLARWGAELRKLNLLTTKSDVLQYVIQHPIGAPVPWLTDTLPDKHILLDGSSLYVTDYKDLFKIYHYDFGGSVSGDKFTLPDLTGRYLIGLLGSGTGSSVGDTFGNIDHTHSVPSHYHGKGNLNINTATKNSGAGTAHTHIMTVAGSHTHQVNPTTTNVFVSNDGSHNDLSVASGSGGSLLNISTDSQGNHSHSNLNESSHTHGIDHTHSSSEFAGSVGDTGGVDGDSAMTSGAANPPSIAVNWITRYTDK